MACVEGKHGITRLPIDGTLCIRRMPMSNTVCITRNPNYDLIVKNMVYDNGNIYNLELTIISKELITYTYITMTGHATPTAYRLNVVDQNGREFLIDNATIDNDVVTDGVIWLGSHDFSSVDGFFGYSVKIDGSVFGTAFLPKDGTYQNILYVMPTTGDSENSYAGWSGDFASGSFCEHIDYIGRDNDNVAVHFGFNADKDTVNEMCGIGSELHTNKIYL